MPKSRKRSKTGKRKQRSAAKSAIPFIPRDRRALEKVHSDISRLLNEQQFTSAEQADEFLARFSGPSEFPQPSRPLTPEELAQDKMYEAWDADGKRRARLAREALSISPDCADAYVLLAEETTKTLEEAKQLFELGVKAGERALGAAYFDRNKGHFWGLLDTRPYMRAREGFGALSVADG